MVLVDNSVYSFAYQVDNGVPIISFYDDQQDEELLHLIYYFSLVVDCKDVRVQNREAFGLYKLGLYASQMQEIIEYGEEEDENLLST